MTNGGDRLLIEKQLIDDSLICLILSFLHRFMLFSGFGQKGAQHCIFAKDGDPVAQV